jgi:hypothetical protein
MWSNAVVLVAVMLATAVFAQDKPPELTPAGKAILQDTLAIDGRPLYDRPGPGKPITFPLAMCTFPGGLCGAVHRDGSVAVPPRYDWVGKFSDNRAAFRLNGLYGFVDEDGREIVKPQYRIVDDYQFGFAQVDVDGKSGLIDRDGGMVIEPKYGFIRAIAPDRFRVSEKRWLGGMTGSEDFSEGRIEYTPAGGVSVSVSEFVLGNNGGDVIDSSGRRVGPLPAPWMPSFDKDDPSIRWVQKDTLWGLARGDGSWLVEPKFQQAGSLIDGLAYVKLNGKVGFINRSGNFVIDPVFDKAWIFERGMRFTWAERDGAVGLIDKTGTWLSKPDYQQMRLAAGYRAGTREPAFGWHFKKANRWGLLDLDGRVVLDADFDQAITRCSDGRLEAYRNKELFYFKADGTPLQPPDGRLIGALCSSVPPFALKTGSKFMLVDANSIPLSALQFDAVSQFPNGVKHVKLDGKWGRVGPDGRWLLEPRFDYLTGQADIFVASVDGKRGFMRADGTWLIEPKFDAAARRPDGDSAFVTIAGATGVVRLADQSWVVPPRPGVMCDINHAIMAQSEGKRAMLSKTGETWIDIDAERIGIYLDTGLLPFLRNAKFGLIDTTGRVVVEPQFEEPVSFVPQLRGIGWTKRDGKWCAIDRRGSFVSNIPCADADPMGGRGRFECRVEP